MNTKKIDIVFFGMDSRFTKIPLLKIAEDYNVIAIFESAPRNYMSSLKKQVIKYIISSLRKLNYIKSKDLTNLSLNQIANKLKIPYYFSTNISSEEVEKILKQLKPDLICVSSLSQLIKKNIIDIPKHGVINFHPSYLPHYRGPNPWFWQYYNMEKEGGVTIHYVDEKEDNGNVIYQERYPIEIGITSEEMWDRAIPLGAHLMHKAIEDIEKDRVTSYPQADTGRLERARNVDANEKIIDWEKCNIERIYHILRGTHTWLHSIDGINKFKSVIILGYKKVEITEDVLLGKRYYKEGNEVVYCKEGEIYIRTKYSFVKFIKELMKLN